MEVQQEQPCVDVKVDLYHDPVLGGSGAQAGGSGLVDAYIVNQFDPLLQGPQSDDGDESHSDDEQYLRRLQEIGDYIARFVCDQLRRPRRGDIVSYYDDVYDGWLVVKIVSGYKASSKYS